MKFSDFIEKYDHPGSIILLEGKRIVRKEDEQNLIEVAIKMAKNSKHILFRSGNASGADFYFTKGITSVDPKRMQVITPYTGHRSKQNYAAETFSLEDINLAAEPDVVYQSKANKKMESLVSKYLAGNIDQYSIKAAYIIRDTVKVLGTEKIPPANFALFYDDLTDPRKGGTGHTINVCIQSNVPHINQTVFFNWVTSS